MSINHEEIRKLLPFYASHTLSEEEVKMIDGALATSEELRKELLFWQLARAATIARAEEQKETHLTPEQIVDYTEEKLSVDQRQSVKEHLDLCEICNAELAMIRETYEKEKEPALAMMSTPHRFFHDLFRTPRLAYGIATFAVIIVAVFIIARLISTSEGGNNRYILAYQLQVRGEKQMGHPSLEIGESASNMTLVLALPHTQIASTRYSVTLRSPDKISVVLSESVQSRASGSAADSLEIRIDVKRLPRDGEYELVAKELPRSIPRELEPQEFSFHFLVTHKIK